MKSRNLWKMIPADVKDNKNKKKLKIWWLYLTNFYKKYLQNLKYNVKSYVLSIWFSLVFYPFWHFLLRTWGGIFLLNEQNLLSALSMFNIKHRVHIYIKLKNWWRQSYLEKRPWVKQNIVNIVIDCYMIKRLWTNNFCHA